MGRHMNSQPKSPGHYFWFPYLIDDNARETTRLNDRQFRLYVNAMIALWRLAGDLTVEDAPQAIGCTPKELTELIAKVPSLCVQDSRLHLPRLWNEYQRAVRVQEGAKKAAAIRWGAEQ